MTASTEHNEEYSKLRWHCRRGVKELDIVLERYLQNHYADASDENKEAFKSLLRLEDPLLLDRLINHVDSEDQHEQDVMSKLRNLFSG